MIKMKRWSKKKCCTQCLLDHVKRHHNRMSRIKTKHCRRKRKCIYSLYPGHLEYEQNDRKVKGQHILKGKDEKRESEYQRAVSN